MIIVRIWQGIGNQLFQYAFAKAVQLKNNEEVYLDVSRSFIDVIEWNVIGRKYSLDCFNISIPKIENVETKYSFLGRKNIFQRIQFWLSYYDVGKLKYDDNINSNINIKDLHKFHGNRYMMGYFQNPLFFEDIREILLQDLSLKEEIVLPDGLSCLINDKESVSVHIRRGDFKKFDMVLPKSYYVDAIEYIKKRLKCPKFLVFSDDQEWVKRSGLFSSDEDVLYCSDNMLKDYEELIVMSRCSHNIIANSTFSWWAAWLNQNKDKIVVAPKQWFPDQADILPSDWVVIK